jgi:hypothetical protein
MDSEHREDRPRPYREIAEDQVEGAQVAFLMAHPSCGEAVDIRRGPWSLVCWCEQCNDLRTYQLVAPAEDEDIPD